MKLKQEVIGLVVLVALYQLLANNTWAKEQGMVSQTTVEIWAPGTSVEALFCLLAISCIAGIVKGGTIESAKQ